ncbi:interferon alpha/beta receptor 1 isoform X1 [Peromyscus maniculatus bairdii]|uniref:interferon alpha/beta receptor 1 isoform X1 n=1 Tax=Peromyscus maniculatus bairdii TaxID=230844 RepID=UPI001C2E5694|nr:interferon alpha/beta receptor 1 isoform X1 [Peromyscus maniculatus bairdii]
MLALLGAAALVLVAGEPRALLAAAGGEDLESPEDIDIYIIDDNCILQWNSREAVDNVTFSAEYRTEEMENWLKLPGCQHITGTECKFSLLDTNVYIKISFRVRAEKGKSTSPWNEGDPFTPFLKAHIGPPGVRLEAEDKAVLVYITRPGQGANMWARENFSFRYRIVIWQKSSGATQIIETTNYTERILKLLPETTYCLKVEAMHMFLRKHSNYSAVQCINTTVADKMPVPENLELDADGESYVLSWDYASPNVSFRAQWLPSYLKSISGDHSDKWEAIPTCAEVRTTRCVFPRDAVHTGTFFLRVQASDGDNTSFWSEEKFINSQKYTSIPAPVIAVTPSRDSLLVYVSCQDSPSTACHGLTYEVSFWKNTSNTKTKVVKGSPEFTIGDLQPRTLYCVQARVHSFAVWNKSSSFSETLCKETRPGNSSQPWIIIALSPVIFSALVLVLYAGRSLLKYLSYVYFASPKPPSSIDEFFSEPSAKNLLFLTPEEHTERCFIIENTDTVAVAGESQAPGEDHRKYSSQTSQDSGNYSNEEGSSGGDSGPGLRPSD